MAAETDKTAKFDLDGTEYEVPDILDLDIDEWLVVYEYCGLVFEDFAPTAPALAAISAEVAKLAIKAIKFDEGSTERAAIEEELAAAQERFSQVRGSLSDEEADAENERVRRLHHPGFMKALFHIGYQRAHPKKTKSAVKDLVGKVKATPQNESDALEEDGAEGETPTSTSEQRPSSEKSSDLSSERLSLASPLSSETPEGPLATIGTSG